MGDEVQGAMSDARIAKRAAMRRATLQLVIAVAVLDAIAMSGYYFLIAHAPSRTKLLFTGLWTIATVIVVMVFLRKVRTARFAKYS